MATRNTTEGVGEKEQRTNEQYRLGSTQRIVLWHCIPCASVDYRQRVFARNFYKLLGMPTHLWPAPSLLTIVDSGLRTHLVNLPHCPWTISRRLVSSAVRCRLLLCVSLHQLPLWVPFSNCLLWRSFDHCAGFSRTCPLLVSSEISIPSPLFGFAPRQTKGSSA